MKIHPVARASLLDRFGAQAAAATVISRCGFSFHAHAIEAAMGRYIPGVFAPPMVGIVPPPGMKPNRPQAQCAPPGDFRQIPRD